MSIKSTYLISLSILLTTGLLFGQQEAVVEEAVVEEAAVEEAAVEEAAVEEAAVEEAAVEEATGAEEEELLEYVEETASSPLSGFNIGVTGSVGFINGEFILNTPVGGSLVISTPYGFKIGEGLRFNISLAFGAYSGTSEWADQNTGEVKEIDISPAALGIGGNLTVAKFIFAEGHLGTVGDGGGVRGFAGVSLERIMKKSLGLPMNVLVGGEGFISTEMKTGYNQSYWGGLGIRFDYSL